MLQRSPTLRSTTERQRVMITFWRLRLELAAPTTCNSASARRRCFCSCSKSLAFSMTTAACLAMAARVSTSSGGKCTKSRKESTAMTPTFFSLWTSG